jgi:hypothetical protein
MDTKEITALVEDIVAKIVGDFGKELKLLGDRVESLQREMIRLKHGERSRRHRELVTAAERDDDDD